MTMRQTTAVVLPLDYRCNSYLNLAQTKVHVALVYIINNCLLVG